MAYLVSGTDLTSVANAIRTAGGTSAQLEFPSGFVTAIGNISGGGGGGAKNFVQGTFTPSSSEKGTAKTLAIPYTGSGYPILVAIFPSTGMYKTNSDIYNLVQNKALVNYLRIKRDTSSTPTYTTTTNEENRGSYNSIYKSDASDATKFSQGGEKDGIMFSTSAASNSLTGCVKFLSATSLSVFVADTSYGFADGIEYTYCVVYSS